MALFKRFVEVGRLAIVRFGQEFDKPVIITDIVDLNRVVIDGPTTGVSRRVITLKRLQLTDFKLDIPKGSSSYAVQQALEAAGADCPIAQWKASAWGQKREKFQAKRQLNDFERFQVQRARCIVAKSA